MHGHSEFDVCSGLERFSVTGVNFHKTDAATRGLFAIPLVAYEKAIVIARQAGVTDLFLLSTCNRTECYGAASPAMLIGIISEALGIPASSFSAHAYQFTGLRALEHLFRVAAGLDSQILGDYEILMQLKSAAKFSRERGMLGTLTDRLVNYALQSSKRIKSETGLSTGTVSVAYAAIEVMRERVGDMTDKTIFLAGTGKFGRSVIRNIRTYFPGARVSIFNRTAEKAARLALEQGCDWLPLSMLAEKAHEADVIITSANASPYLVLPSFFDGATKPRLLLDLSVPTAIDPLVVSIPGSVLLDVDEISHILDRTLALRRGEIPKAEAIIGETLGEFVNWHKMHLHSHFLKAVKNKLVELSADARSAAADTRIQKAVETLAIDLRQRNAKGCQYIATINDYLHG